MLPRIEPGDRVLVDYGKEPHPGEVVIAMLDGGKLVRKFLRQKGRIILHPTNPRCSDIAVEIKEGDRFMIAGAVLRIVLGAI